MQGVYTIILFYRIILFCHNHRKDRFDEPASCFRLDEKADLPVDHRFPKLALGRLFVGSTTLVNKVPKNPVNAYENTLYPRINRNAIPVLYEPDASARTNNTLEKELHH